MTSKSKSSVVSGRSLISDRPGKHGGWISELLPYTARIADELCIIRSMHAEAINHDPAITYIQTGP